MCFGRSAIEGPRFQQIDVLIEARDVLDPYTTIRAELTRQRFATVRGAVKALQRAGVTRRSPLCTHGAILRDCPIVSGIPYNGTP